MGMECNIGAIERGRIREAAGTGYIVESLDRKGIVSPPLSPIFDSAFSQGDTVLKN